jgi:hypothetical protein
MKKNHLMIGAAIALSAFTACSSTNTAKNDADILSQYVDSVDHLEPVYTEANWKAIDEGYRDRNKNAENNIASMPAGDKEKVESAQAKYAALKNKYEEKIIAGNKAELDKEDYKVKLRKDLFNDKLGAEMTFAWMTPANAVETYERFVKMVESHKNDYTKEDWDEIKVLYKALDTRKEQIDGDISAGDRMKIAGLKTEYKVIKGVHRPLADKE